MKSIFIAITMVAGCTADTIDEPEDVIDDEGEMIEEPELVVEEGMGLAAGCTSALPTSIGGSIVGYPDNYSVNAAIGVHLVDSAGRSVDGGGTRCSVAANNCNGASNYAYFIRANPMISELGVPSSEPGMTRSWSRCVAPAVKRMYLEGYPRNALGKTDNTKYASTMSNRVDIPAGATVRYGMRFPRRFEYTGGGNTGNVNGWAYCNGQPTPVTRLNAWTLQPSTACGIRAYKSGGNIGNANGYWWIGPLAAGQCNAPAQAVGVVAHVTCNGTSMHQTKHVDIVRDKTLGAINFYFP
jgi:hypothetical protein